MILYMVHSWCCVFYGSRQRYNDVYPLLKYHTEQFHNFKNLMLHLLIPPSPPSPLATTDFLTVSIALLFPECHRVGIVKEKNIHDTF